MEEDDETIDEDANSDESFYESGEEQEFDEPEPSEEEARYAAKLFTDDDFITVGQSIGRGDAGEQHIESQDTAQRRMEEEEDYDIDGEESGEEIGPADDEEPFDPEDGEGPDACETTM